jgi:hypothetical protein
MRAARGIGSATMQKSLMKILKCLLTALALAGPSSAFAGAIVAGFNTSSLAANDDSSTGLLSLGFTANFFGTNYTGVWVNNNGNLTFAGPMSSYTPFNLYTTGIPIIAPFFGDVDTRGSGSDLLRYGSGTFDGHSAFGATWDGVGVGYYALGADKLNQFQALLVERGDTGAGNFDIYFNYNQIQWETGGASGGSNGLGGSSARAGYSNGLAVDSYELPGSAINGALLDSNPTTGLIHGSNDNLAGRYVFQVRNGGVIVPPGTSVPDTGSTLLMLSFALGLIVFMARRRA